MLAHHHQQTRSPQRRQPWSLRMLLFTTVVVVLLLVPQGVYGSGKKCSTNSIYQCPNCDGIEVKDCFECDGFLSTEPNHKICFNRVLFNRHNTDSTDYSNYYHFLWNDLIAAVIWFFIAGVAVSCGVGGGGIFVPLGVLVLQFSPKQAAGLSQCSIFGSTLGGLVLNSRGKHPNEHITDQPGIIVPVDTTTTTTSTDDVTTTAAANDTPPTEITSDNSGTKKTPTTTDSSSGVIVAIQEKLSQSALASYTGTFYTRPVIHYDMVLFLAPMEIAGALMGVIVQILIPNWLYLILASIVLSITAYKTFGKFSTQRHKEQLNEVELQKELAAENNAAANAVDTEGDEVKGEAKEGAICTNEKTYARQETTGMATVNTTSEESGSSMGDSASNTNHHNNNNHINSDAWEDTEETKVLRQQYLVDEMRQFPKEKIIGLLAIWIVIFVLTLLRGGKGVPSLIGITCESIWYSILIVLQFIWLLGSASYFGIQLLQKQKARIQVRYPFQIDDTVWDVKALRFFGTCTFLAGLLAGLIGIGGGMILGPLMLVMGLHPRVSSASTATMIVLTSSSVAVLFVTSGLVPWSYALFYFMVCFLGAVINKSRIDAYVKRTGRASVLIFILASIILFATVGCMYNLLSGLSAKDWCLDGFNQFCKASSKNDDCPIDRALSYGITFLSN